MVYYLKCCAISIFVVLGRHTKEALNSPGCAHKNQPYTAAPPGAILSAIAGAQQRSLQSRGLVTPLWCPSH